MIRKLQDGLYQIRGALVCNYLLIDGSTAILIDSGFVGAIPKIEKALKREGLGWKNVRAILLTHGHIDHCYNVAEIVRRSGARVYGHPADEAHFEGTYRYEGLNRICGVLVKCGAFFFGYEPVSEDWALKDGDLLELWGGLEVVHLPGHTFGHCGFYSRKRNLLFCGDLFATDWFGTVLPWPGLNSCSELFPKAIEKVAALAPGQMLVNHCDRSSPRRQRERFWRKYVD